MEAGEFYLPPMPRLHRGRGPPRTSALTQCSGGLGLGQEILAAPSLLSVMFSCRVTPKPRGGGASLGPRLTPECPHFW